jgi:hypothetical protein
MTLQFQGHRQLAIAAEVAVLVPAAAARDAEGGASLKLL